MGEDGHDSNNADFEGGCTVAFFDLRSTMINLNVFYFHLNGF